MQQEVVLALLAKEPSHGYQLRTRLREALGPVGDAMNAGQIYVTLTRLEKAGLVASEQSAGLADRPDRKVYGLTPAGQQRVADWLTEVSWPRPDLAEFHLKLVAAAAAGLADPIAIVDTQRRELLRRLRDAQRAAMAEPDRSAAGLLLEGIVLRLQADLRWLEACERTWTTRRAIMNETGGAPILGARALRKEYGREAGLVRAVDGVDLDVAAGETLAVMGPSGCGKSTLLHLLGGLDRPTSGELSLAGQRIDAMGERGLARLRREAVGFVFQAFHLMDELTAAENVELPALLAGVSPRRARRRAADLLEQVGLADRARFLPSALSGGQRQRVAVARALANEPLIVLADEPTGNLDSEATLDVLRLFDSLHTAGQTLVIVTHDARIAATADRLISMRDGAFIDQTRLTGGSTGNLAALAGLEG